MVTSTNDKNLRLNAARRQMVLVKRRDQQYAPVIGHGYMVLDAVSGAILAGHKFELTPEDVRVFLNNH